MTQDSSDDDITLIDLLDRAKEAMEIDGPHAKLWVDTEEVELLQRYGAEISAQGQECGYQTYYRVLTFCGCRFVNAFFLPNARPNTPPVGFPC